MNRRAFLGGTTTAITIGLAGCSANSGGDSTDGGDGQGVEPADESAGARSEQSLRLVVGEELAGSEWQSIGATYPRDRFTVQSAQHEDIFLGVDTSGDGTADEEFGTEAISGVNNNDFSFTIEVDSGYTLTDGDTVLVDYPAVDNPAEPGEYEVELTINEVQTGTVTVTIG